MNHGGQLLALVLKSICSLYTMGVFGWEAKKSSFSFLFQTSIYTSLFHAKQVIHGIFFIKYMIDIHHYTRNTILTYHTHVSVNTLLNTRLKRQKPMIHTPVLTKFLLEAHLLVRNFFAPWFKFWKDSITTPLIIRSYYLPRIASLIITMN